MTGLQPDTEYSYRVVVKDEEWAEGVRWDWSPAKKALVKAGRYDNRFRTNPEPDTATASLTFAVIGDFGVGTRKESQDRRQQQVADALKAALDQHDLRFVLTTGDNIYAGKKFLGIPVGDTGDEDDDWFFTYFQPYRYVINRVCVYPSIGNHDAGESEDNDDREQVEDNFYVRDPTLRSWWRDDIRADGDSTVKHRWNASTLSAMSAGFAQFPDMLRWPFASPRRRHKVRVGRGRISGRLQLDQIFDEELMPAEQPDPLTVGQLIYNRVPILKAGEAEVIFDEVPSDGVLGDIEADVTNGARHAEGEQAPWPENARDFGNGRVRRRKRHGAVIAEHHLKCIIAERQPFGIALHERRTPRPRARVDQLLIGQIETDRARPGFNQCIRPLGGSASEFEHIAVFNLLEGA